MKPVKAVKAVKSGLKDYCKNTNLVGVGYISNTNIHLSERIFWSISLIVAAGLSYNLVREYQRTFESNAISFVVENAGIWSKTNFISIGICDNFLDRPRTEKYLQRMYKTNESVDEGILDFVNEIVNPVNHLYGSVESHCSYLQGCSDCVQCPHTGYREIADAVVRKCPEIMINCSWNGVPFDCCNYFLPLNTPRGKCLALNSLHATTKNSTHWLKTEIGFEDGDGELVLNLNIPFDVYLLNEEDIPSLIEFDKGFSVRSSQFIEFELYVQDMINDPEIRQISPKYRKCKFPDENAKDSAYDFYSFSVCAVDCLKRFQFEKCGCNMYQLLVKNDDKISPCDYNGMLCLDRNSLTALTSNAFKPWSTDEIKCECEQSCNEKDHTVISTYFYGEDQRLKDHQEFQLKIKQTRSSELFRRQAIRTRLDIVVTIGGILGLFMGASLISVVEILYYICIRIFNSSE